MSDNTKIEWADATVNAVNGCTVVSPGCKHCYAMKQAHRFPARQGLTQQSAGGMVWTGEVRLNEKPLLQPLAWRRPRRIFWNAHGDLFHESVPDEWIDKVFAVAALTPQHTHMILTKRAARMREYLDDFRGDWSRIDGIWREIGKLTDAGAKIDPEREIDLPLPNVWLGVSVEDQARADERIPDLLATPAAVRFLSCEPLLGPVNLNAVKFLDRITEHGGREAGWESALNGLRYDMWVGDDEDPMKPGHPKLDWVIAGGESGPGARPMHPDWVRSLRDQCKAAGTAFFFKQWGEWLPFGSIDGDGNFNSRDRGEKPGLWHVWPSNGFSVRVGKQQAGRLLDGIEHSEFPA